MSSRTVNRILVWVFLFKAGISLAQDTDSLSVKYPGELAVYTHFSEHLILEFEKGELTARSEVLRDMLLLNDNATSFFNTGTVYHSYFNQLENIEGATLVPNGKGFKSIAAEQVKTRPSESESVFYDDAKETEITFTHLKKGVQTHLQYTIRHQEIHMLPRFFFQNVIPMLHASFSITYPKEVAVQGIMQGVPAGWVKKSEETSRKTITVTWEATNVPKAKVFDNAPRFSYYSPHLMVFIKNYTDPRTGKETEVLGNASDLNRYLYGFVRNVNTKEDKDIAGLVGSLTKDARNDNEKAAAIYKWVQGNIRYVAFEDSLGGFIPREAATVYRRRFGDCKDMAGLLRAMCKAAGFDARYVWIGTRDLPYTVSSTPVPSVFNHMICAAKIDGKWTFLDGTDPILPYGAIPQAIQGKEALISNTADNFELIKIPVMQSDISQVVDSSFVQIQDNSIEGQVSIQLSGYSAWDIKTLLKYKNEKEQEKAINAITQRGTNKYAQKKFDYKMSDDPSREVVISAGFEIPDYVRKAGKDCYVNLNLLRNLSGSKVDISDRTASIENDYREVNKQVVVMDIPKGYKVSYLPGPRQEAVDGIGAYNIRYDSNGKTVTLSKEIKMDALYIQPDRFTDFNKMVSALQSAYKESIVLTAEP